MGTVGDCDEKRIARLRQWIRVTEVAIVVLAGCLVLVQAATCTALVVAAAR